MITLEKQKNIPDVMRKICHMIYGKSNANAAKMGKDFQGFETSVLVPFWQNLEIK